MKEIRIERFQPEDAMALWKENEEDKYLSTEEMIAVYTSPGSRAYTIKLEVEGESVRPIACGGVINMLWKRGEAWILVSPLYRQYIKSAYALTKLMFQEIVDNSNMRRIQAVTYSDKCSLFKHLGFIKEAVLEHYGPNGEDGIIYKLVTTPSAKADGFSSRSLKAQSEP